MKRRCQVEDGSGGGQEAEGQRGLGWQPPGPGRLGEGRDQGRRDDSPVPAAAPARASALGAAFKLADRVLFRLLSRDEDPFLQFEYPSSSKDSAGGGGVGAGAHAGGGRRRRWPRRATSRIRGSGARRTRSQRRCRRSCGVRSPRSRTSGRAAKTILQSRGPSADLVLGGDDRGDAQPAAGARRIHRAAGAVPRPCRCPRRRTSGRSGSGC